MLIREIIENKADMISGEFRVFGTPRQWYLSDSTGVIPFTPKNFDTGAGMYAPHIDDVVGACLLIDYGDDGEAVEIVGRVEPLDVPTSPLLVLPQPVVTYPDLAEELAGYISNMRYEHLRNFLDALLLQDEVALGLVRARASRDQHHPEEGGLLRHVTEMARRTLKHELYPEPSEYERELLLVAVIVHDIGKAQAGFLSKRRATKQHKGHKDIGKDLIKRPLALLKEENPAMAEDLRAVLTDILGKCRTFETKVGLLLQALDQASAFRDADKQAFDGLPASTRRAHLSGKPGAGRTYYRVRHLTVIK
jgi:hypothetical protein